MHERLLKVAEVVRQDPDVIGFAMSAGSTTFNTGHSSSP
jgi:HAE1 family hydrophobic/amphiphilic exporter-1